MPQQREAKTFRRRRCKKELAITQLLGSGYKTIPNTSDSLLLCLSKKDNNSERMDSVHAVVWDKIAEKIIFQKKFPGGKVSWYDAGHIKVVQMPGIVRDNEGAKSVIINIRTGEKQRLGDQLK